ncbi:hypothetical protein Egran_01020 [Elaphomyces granulatus]|uniref:Peptidase A1 domain-containing protein n=1 Tax=Elaphomyces granulatus TaxID=519963 RepID=A0A232M4B4_9EURO|nr:hypothetical protein Egran_01020 [Elaphomyces granulatus]
MHLLQYALLATFYSMGVSAFFPYIIGSGASSTDSKLGSNKLMNRFFPLRRPTNKENDDKEYRAPTWKLRKVPRLMRDNQYKIYPGDPPSMNNSLAINQDGRDYSYFSVINLGSKNKEMWMLLDTGGANTWVFGSNCSSSACTRHNTFGSGDSTSLAVSTNTWNVGYGTGTVNGVLASDKVSFADFNLQLTFGLASFASDDFLNYPMDGILGLGRPGSSDIGTSIVMDEMIKAKYLKSNIVAFSLQRHSDNATDGEITFGDVDKTKFIGSISYTNTTNGSNRWEIPVGDASVDGKSCNFTDKTAIIDTGTSFILLPPDDASALHRLIPGSSPSGEDFIVPCSSTARVQFTFSGITYSIPPRDYVGTSINSSPNCLSNIVGHQPFGPDVWLLGDVFLKNVYSVFDFDNNRVGFAGRNASSPPTIAITRGSTIVVTENSAASASSTSDSTASSSTGFASAAQVTNSTSPTITKAAAANISIHPLLHLTVFTSLFYFSLLVAI